MFSLFTKFNKKCNKLFPLCNIYGKDNGKEHNTNNHILILQNLLLPLRDKHYEYLLRIERCVNPKFVK